MCNLAADLAPSESDTFGGSDDKHSAQIEDHLNDSDFIRNPVEYIFVGEDVETVFNDEDISE
jgi:hypothetical protein